MEELTRLLEQVIGRATRFTDWLVLLGSLLILAAAIWRIMKIRMHRLGHGAMDESDVVANDIEALN